MTDEQKQVVAPSGGQTDAVTTGDSVELDIRASDPSGDDAWKAFPKQVQAAITYASSNTYDYGPRFRNLELEYEVLSARLMDDEITRVVLEYKPKSKFKGASGSEYLDVDQKGVVQARRQIVVPKESMPWLLIGVASLSLIAAFVLVPLILFVEDEPDLTFVSGRNLYVQSDSPKVQPYVAYDGLDGEGVDREWLIIPEGEGTEIAWVKLTITNPTSGIVSLNINSSAAEITTRDGLTVAPVNISERVRWPADGAEVNQRMNTLSLPLWGSLSLEDGQQVTGFMAFEVPAGSSIRSLRWSATDVVTLRY